MKLKISYNPDNKNDSEQANRITSMIKKLLPNSKIKHHTATADDPYSRIYISQKSSLPITSDVIEYR